MNGKRRTPTVRRAAIEFAEAVVLVLIVMGFFLVLNAVHLHTVHP